MSDLADQAVKDLENACDAMRGLYNELIETNPIAAVYVLEQMTAMNETRNKMANVAGLL